jgi:hypothetical protein
MCKSRVLDIDRLGTVGPKVRAFLQRPLLWSPLSLLAGIAIGVVVMGSADAMHGGRHAVGKGNGVLNALRFDNTDLLVVFAVNSAGEIQPYYYSSTGNREEYAPVKDPIAEPTIEIEVGNPKVCWKTSGGDEECVVY